MIWGIDPWVLAALVIWGGLGPIAGVILGWRIARDRTIRPEPVHSRELSVGISGGSRPSLLAPIWDRLAPRSWRP